MSFLLTKCSKRIKAHRLLLPEQTAIEQKSLCLGIISPERWLTALIIDWKSNWISHLCLNIAQIFLPNIALKLLAGNLNCH